MTESYIESKDGSLIETKDEKNKIFELENIDSYQKYKEIKSKLVNIVSPSDNTEISSNDYNNNLEKLYNLWEEVLTSPEFYPSIVYAMFFEKSLDFFILDSSQSLDLKKDIVGLQLATMRDPHLSDEVKNTCKGMWSYYLDDYFKPQPIIMEHSKGVQGGVVMGNDVSYDSSGKRVVKSILEDEVILKRNDISRHLKDTVRRYYDDINEIKAKEKSSTKSLLDSEDIKMLTLALDGVAGDEDLKSLRYFGYLYKQDTEPIEPNTNNFVDVHPLDISDSVHNTVDRHPPRVSMPTHYRQYSIVNNRLPSLKSIFEDRAVLVLAKNGANVGFELLKSVLDFYCNRIRTLRTSEKYKSLDKEAKTKMRIQEMRDFIRELLNPDSQLRSLLNDIDDKINDSMDRVLKDLGGVDTVDVTSLELFVSVKIN